MQQVLSITQPQLAQQRDLVGVLFSALERQASGLGRCWHRRLSFPMTRNGKTVRRCLKCGMSRSFDLHTWKTIGPFFPGD